ncbi:NAD(P)-dependent oxidoreductase [Sediminibacillus massiliensis]|uniref:NAD(P)-dependent oxidoreductase n=1 Tax=Sediminibacillus massiliensis TaxID=1926277 RepID=UPI000988542D|nr:NAD(P)-dependent oxidoreductase [Sediminibacillus massiliensis]
MAIKSIGFIGLGAMGLPMAKNLVKAGYDLHVSAHRNREPIEQLKSLGANEQISLADVAANSEVLISILPTDREMESVLLSDEVLNSLPEDAILIEMTSGSAAMMKKVNETYQKQGIRVLDGPVSGGTAGAEQGTLTVMTGGKTEVLEEVRPVLDAMAKNIYLVGDVGAGKAIKAINQMLAGIHMIASAEAVALAEKLDIDKSAVKDVIGNSSGASWMLLNKIDTLSERNFEPGFKLNLMKKDVQIAVDEGQDLDMPLAQLALDLYKKYEEDAGELDFSAISQKVLS